jgi:hypothetical protein
VICADELEHFGAQLRVPSALAVDERRQLGGGNVDGRVEDAVDAMESIGR